LGDRAEACGAKGRALAPIDTKAVGIRDATPTCRLTMTADRLENDGIPSNPARPSSERTGRAVKIVLIVGARPNFVKVAPILEQLRECQARSVLVHTGQHHDDALSGSFFRELDIPEPDVRLSVTSRTAPERLAEMIASLAPILVSHKPDV